MHGYAADESDTDSSLDESLSTSTVENVAELVHAIDAFDVSPDDLLKPPLDALSIDSEQTAPLFESGHVSAASSDTVPLHARPAKFQQPPKKVLEHSVTVAVVLVLLLAPLAFQTRPDKLQDVATKPTTAIIAQPLALARVDVHDVVLVVSTALVLRYVPPLPLVTKLPGLFQNFARTLLRLFRSLVLRPRLIF